MNGDINNSKAIGGFSLIALVGVAILAGVALSHCDGPQPAPTPTVTTSPATVAVEPLYVPLCHDVDGTKGPCVDMDSAGSWIYVPSGSTWDRGQVIILCHTEDGGAVPCAWIPSVQGNGQGDSGAYVYGVTDAGARPFPADEPAVALADCVDTPQGQGPCTMVDYGTDGALHLFYVPGGFVYGDVHVRDMGVWQ